MTISSRNAACSRACTPLVVCGCKERVTLTFVVAAAAPAAAAVVVVCILEATVEGWEGDGGGG